MGASSEFGIHCDDITALQDRLRVTRGIQLLYPTTAELQGYYSLEVGRVMVPLVADLDYAAPSLLEPTPADIDAIVAGRNTQRVMRLCRVPRAIAAPLLRQCLLTNADDFDESKPYQRLADGIVGLPVGSRLDDANQLSVSVNENIISSVTGRPSKVGDHIDTWRNPSLALMIANEGPGWRWHRITPEFNRGAAGGAGRTDRMQFLNRHENPDSMTTYWIRLNAPTSEYIEVLFNSPVAWALHDGSTAGSLLPSRAFYCTTNPVKKGAYPSPLVA
jgi:hypothetical protein